MRKARQRHRLAVHQARMDVTSRVCGMELLCVLFMPPLLSQAAFFQLGPWL